MRPLRAFNRYRPSISVIAFIFSLLAVVNNKPISGIAGSTFRQNTPSSAAIHKTIKSTAEKLVDSRSAIIKLPVFNYQKDTKQLEYNLGGVRIEALELEPDDPYLMPFEKQIQVEALRRLFTNVVPEETFWQSILIQAEQIIDAAVQDIESTTAKSELQEKLDSRSQQIDQEIGKLHEAIRLHAQQKGYTARRVGRGLASDTFTVEVVKTPDNGRVQVLPWVKYVKCATLRKCGDNWRWRELVSKQENMIGEYYYQAQWPSGQRNEGQIDVRNNTTITFQPR